MKPGGDANGSNGHATGSAEWHGMRDRAAHFWVASLGRLSARWPRAVRMLKPLCAPGAWHASPTIQHATLANAARVLGPDAPIEEREALAKAVCGSFYEFIAEVGRNSRRSPRGMLVEVEEIQGHEAYMRVRAQKRGAILAVAHMGSYEIAMAALREFEPRIHVVFRRDTRDFFESQRRALHERLGVHEAPLDDGWGIWYHLRDSLCKDEVVLIQADRVLPGHKGVAMPFLHGHVEIPTGPVKLAMASGAPIVPVFAIRTPDGRVRIIIEDAIEAPAPWPREGVHPALVQLTRIIESYVKRYPEQWLLFHPAWMEDQPHQCAPQKGNA